MHSKTVNLARLVFVCVKKQWIGDGNFSCGEIIVMGKFFAIGSTGLKAENKYLVSASDTNKHKSII